MTDSSVDPLALHGAGLAYHGAAGASGPDTHDRFSGLAEFLDRTASELDRHPDDEEEIVIPLLCGAR